MNTDDGRTSAQREKALYDAATAFCTLRGFWYESGCYTYGQLFFTVQGENHVYRAGVDNDGIPDKTTFLTVGECQAHISQNIVCAIMREIRNE